MGHLLTKKYCDIDPCPFIFQYDNICFRSFYSLNIDHAQVWTIQLYWNGGSAFENDSVRAQCESRLMLVIKYD